MNTILYEVQVGEHEGPHRYSAAADIQPTRSAVEHSDSRSKCGIDAAMITEVATPYLRLCEWPQWISEPFFAPTTRRCLVVAWSRALEGNAEWCADQVQWGGSPGNRTLILRIKRLT